MSNQQKKGVPAFLESRMAKAKYVIGADECGWGCVAGPLVVAACAVMNPYVGPQLRDSKKYGDKSRRDAEAVVKQVACYYEIVEMSATAIKLLGPAEALRLAYVKALYTVRSRIDMPDDEVLVIVDGSNKIGGFDHPHYCLPKADDRIIAVSAASILGKVHRDNYMVEVNEDYPEFTFREHKGYPTAAHYEELRRYGVTLEHRRNIAYVQETLEKTGKYDE